MCETLGSSDWRNSSINSATMDMAEDAPAAVAAAVAVAVAFVVVIMNGWGE